MFFLAIGFAGFFPGMTQNFNTIEMGYGSEAMVLGLFQVSFLHNIVHLLFGAVAIAQSRFSNSARRGLAPRRRPLRGAVDFGLLANQDSAANFLPLNTVDTWAYFVLAVVMVGLSFLSSDVTPATAKADHRS